MNYHQRNHRLFLHFAAAILILAGCAARIQKPMPLCPGAGSAAEALSVLRSQSQNTLPIRANGRCLLQCYTDGKKRKENFPVKLWMSPPNEIYLQGDVAFNAKGIVVGSNEREFWMSMKPKEISSYWWGRWFGGSCLETLVISPELLLEALGIAVVGKGQDSKKKNWSLSNSEGLDVLTKRRGRTEARKIYIDACDYLVRRIEYFDANGEVVVVTELDKYKELLEGFFVPAVIKITRPAGQAEDSVSITLSLKSIKPADFTEKQRNRLFERPRPRGFEHIYEINEDCETIEQPQ